MINHDTKTILINISGTGSEGLEVLLSGCEYWYILQGGTWMCSQQAKQAYQSAHAGGKDYWDEYFKFSMVRNPNERVLSNLNAHKIAQRTAKIGFNEYDHIDQLLDFRWYLASKYTPTYGVIVEQWTSFVWMPTYGHVPQYSTHIIPTIDEIMQHGYKENNIYGNILKEPLNALFHSENYEEAVHFLADKYQIPDDRVSNALRFKPLPHISIPTHELPERLKGSDLYTTFTVDDLRPDDITMINDLYRDDFIKYGYEMIDPGTVK